MEVSSNGPLNPLKTENAFSKEPKSFRPATPPPSVVPYFRREYGGHGEIVGEEEIEVQLISGHPLWGEFHRSPSSIFAF